MPCSACGSSISSIRPPSRSISSIERSNTSATPGSTPSAWCEKSRATPTTSPSRSSREGNRTPPSIPTEVESRRSRPSIAPSSRAASVTSRVSGPAWSSDDAKATIP